MPSLEDLHRPDTIYYKNGKPYRPIDVLQGVVEDDAPRKAFRKYSTRRIKRKLIAASDRFLADPTSFSEARERGLNYWVDSGE